MEVADSTLLERNVARTDLEVMVLFASVFQGRPGAPKDHHVRRPFAAPFCPLLSAAPALAVITRLFPPVLSSLNRIYRPTSVIHSDIHLDTHKECPFVDRARPFSIHLYSGAPLRVPAKFQGPLLRDGQFNRVRTRVRARRHPRVSSSSLAHNLA